MPDSPAPVMEKASTAPVFVVGAPRSGTTLAYSILLSSGEYPLYRAESKILECREHYGPLRRRSAQERFLRDFLNSLQFTRSGLPAEIFTENIGRTKTYAAFLRFFMEAMARKEGKRRWAEKSPLNVLFMEKLSKEFPDARFVHVIRDGRDVALSQRKSGFVSSYSKDQKMQLLWAGLSWQECVDKGRRSGELLPPERYMEVRYEDLITDTDRSLERLAAFADVDLSQEKLAENPVGALGEANTAFDKPMAGVSKSAMARWKTSLSKEDLLAFESVLHAKLTELGYEVEYDPSSRMSASLKLHARLSLKSQRLKRFLRRNTILGRFARPPLEVGVE